MVVKVARRGRTCVTSNTLMHKWNRLKSVECHCLFTLVYFSLWQQISSIWKADENDDVDNGIFREHVPLVSTVISLHVHEHVICPYFFLKLLRWQWAPSLWIMSIYRQFMRHDYFFRKWVSFYFLKKSTCIIVYVPFCGVYDDGRIPAEIHTPSLKYRVLGNFPSCHAFQDANSPVCLLG